MGKTVKKEMKKALKISHDYEIAVELSYLDFHLDYLKKDSDGNLRIACKSLVDAKNLNAKQLKSELSDALCEIEKLKLKVEAYELSISKIKPSLKLLLNKPKGGRPRSKWGEKALICAQKYFAEEGKLPSPEGLKEMVTLIAEESGEFGHSNSDGVFSVDTAKQYLKYFKNNLPLFQQLDATYWLNLQELGYFS